jgi:basic membrane lipoprotein Med (substrate-binding protein (PBP1-ABC) superfamily)
MKIYRIIALVTVSAFILMACGSPASPVATPIQPPTAVPAKPFRVAVIMPSAVNDIAFSQSMFDALNRIQTEMGGPEKMQYVYSQGMGVIDDATAALEVYASKGYDLVIAHGSQYGPSIQEVAPKHPKVSFVWSNASKPSNLPNVFDMTAGAQEGGYVNGVLAAALTKSKVIGIIGPVEVGESKRYIDGFKAGVAATNPEVQVNVTYIGSFSDVVKASEVANGYIASSTDIMTGTGQMVIGPIGKANENNVLWFGTQSDQTAPAPKVVVANQVYHWEVVLDKVIAQVKSGKLGGETFNITLANGGEVIEYNPVYSLPSDIKALGDKTIKGIKDGTIKVTLP